MKERKELTESLQFFDDNDEDKIEYQQGEYHGFKKVITLTSLFEEFSNSDINDEIKILEKEIEDLSLYYKNTKNKLKILRKKLKYDERNDLLDTEENDDIMFQINSLSEGLNNEQPQYKINKYKGMIKILKMYLDVEDKAKTKEEYY